MGKKMFVILAVFLITGILVSCEKMLPPAPQEEKTLAGTIPGLSSHQENQHLIGDEAFAKIFGKADGLGPLFVQESCSNCHVGNGKGHPSTILTRFAKVDGSTVDYLLTKGGPQLQEHSIDGYFGESIPVEANVFSKRLAPLVMGLGYVAAISDQSILDNADPDDMNGDGISGRANYVLPTDFFSDKLIHLPLNGRYIGRFGKKAEKITLLDQVVFALNQDMGITSEFDTHELYNVHLGDNPDDRVPDPEVSSGFVNSLVFYLRTLKAPQRRNTNEPDVMEGERLFSKIGCTSCHLPDFTTTVSDIPALSEKSFHPYSDFLLHDMGEILDDRFPEGSANSNEWRTPPLWGIGLANDSQGGGVFLLHDGRAASIEDAIAFHGGEAAGRRTSFYALTTQQKNQIVKFLQSL